mmetsp:Transcript_108268/g.337400  ORF Transcript_108268/g.337400 Transcript_108268/m.337400 type:complete len:208 (+) Transcript_108268:366-989(+)
MIHWRGTSTASSSGSTPACRSRASSGRTPRASPWATPCACRAASRTSTSRRSTTSCCRPTRPTRSIAPTSLSNMRAPRSRSFSALLAHASRTPATTSSWRASFCWRTRTSRNGGSWTSPPSSGPLSAAASAVSASSRGRACRMASRCRGTPAAAGPRRRPPSSGTSRRPFWAGPAATLPAPPWTSPASRGTSWARARTCCPTTRSSR